MSLLQSHLEFFFETVVTVRVCTFSTENTNKPRTDKIGAIPKAQNLKGGPFGLCETPDGCKKF